MPTDGVVPLCATFDHVGPIARSVADAADIWAVIAGRSLLALETPQPATLTLGALGGYFTALLEPMSVVRTKRRSDASARRVCASNQKRVQGTEAIVDTYVDISLPEAANWHAPTLDTRAADYQPPVRERLERGRTIPAVKYLHARDVRVELTRAVDAALDGCSALVLPTLPIVAPTLGAADVSHGQRARGCSCARRCCA